jgi:hypothetical protein
MVRPGQSSHPAPSARDRRDPIGAAIERLFPASGAGPLEWPLLDARVDGPAIPRPPVQREAGGIRPSEGGPVRAAVLGAGRVAGETVGAEESQPAVSSDGLAEASRRRFGRVPALGFATAPNASTYRAVMAVFAGAQAHYKPQLRADEVLDALDAEGYEYELPDNDEMAPLRQIEAVLEMLEGWTLVRHSQDNTPARTKTEFLRQRHLWQITEIGEAAHRLASRAASSLVARPSPTQRRAAAGLLTSKCHITATMAAIPSGASATAWRTCASGIRKAAANASAAASSPEPVAGSSKSTSTRLGGIDSP